MKMTEKVRASRADKEIKTHNSCMPTHDTAPSHAKMKSRLTVSDIRACVRDVGCVVTGLRALNIYDIDDRTFLIRLAGTCHAPTLAHYSSCYACHANQQLCIGAISVSCAQLL